MRRVSRSGGFTLIEAALVIVIIGVAVVAMLELLATGTKSNASARSATTAVTVARSAREFLLTQTFAQVTALNGTTYSPAIDATGQPMDTFGDGWQQTIQVTPIDPNNVTAATSAITPAGVRITVHVVRNSQRVESISWIQFRVN